MTQETLGSEPRQRGGGRPGYRQGLVGARDHHCDPGESHLLRWQIGR